MKKAINVYLEQKVIKKLDEQAKKIGVNRSVYLTLLIMNNNKIDINLDEIK